MNDFYGYLRQRQLAEIEGASIGPGLGDLAGPKEFGDDPASRGGTNQTREAFQDLASLMGSAFSTNSGKGLLNQSIALIMKDVQVPERIKKEISDKVKARWSSIIDLTDASGRGDLPGSNGQGISDPTFSGQPVRPSQVDTGF